MMEKRYQVFISSTFKDLEEERQEVMRALLELGCIPSAMELFPAANEPQWNLIKKVIDGCDYCVLIIAGRYGSVDEAGISYTEKEYRYAMSISKPTVAFLHRHPERLAADRCEPTQEGKEKLSRFRSNVERNLCKQWETPQELGGVVSRSLFHLIRSTPAIGWIRADESSRPRGIPHASDWNGIDCEELSAEFPDCKFLVGPGGLLSIAVPGSNGPYDLATDKGVTNAPRALFVADGDFDVVVQVDGRFLPGSEPTLPGRKPYNGAGLVVMADPRNALTLVKAAFSEHRSNPRPYTNFEIRLNGNYKRFGETGDHSTIPASGPLFLRLQRHGQMLWGAKSLNGREWESLGAEEIPPDWTESLQVGVIAVNTSNADFNPRFTNFQFLETQ